MTSETKTVYRACNLCEAICGLEIKVKDNNIISIKGDKKDPFSRGHICPKGTALQDLQEDPDRLKFPVKKVGEDFLQITWEEAYQIIADNIASIQAIHGNNAVGIYAGNPSVHNYGTMTHGSVLRKSIGTKNNFSASSIDQLPHQLVSYAMYGHQFMIPIPDIDHTDYMLMLGANPLASNGSLMTVPDVKARLKAIQERGGKVIVIDPRKTETAKLADEHFFIKPGTDAFFLLALIHQLLCDPLENLGHLEPHLEGLEDILPLVTDFTADYASSICGIPATKIKTIAKEITLTKRAVCYGRMGVSTQIHGTLCQWAIQVINILAGNLDVRGGAIVPTPAFANISSNAESGPGNYIPGRSRVSGKPMAGGEIPCVSMAEEITTPGEGQIKSMVTIAGNPILSTPDGRGLEEAFQTLDFMVSIDFYINETTAHADVILPPTSTLEHDHYDVVFNRFAVRDVTRYNEPVIIPEDSTKHDWEIMNELASVIAKAKDIDSQPLPPPHQIIDRGIQYGPYGAKSDHDLALSLAKLKANPHGIDLGPLKPGLPQRLASHHPKIILNSAYILEDIERVKRSADANTSKGLLLIGRRHIRSNNSWMHNSKRLVKGKMRSHLFMNPEDMKSLGINDRAKVEISSAVGSVITEVEANEDMMLGVVSLPHGWGHKGRRGRLSTATEKDGVSCNDITDTTLIDAVSGNAAVNGVPVTVSALV
ncbi:molybdopterin-dependent oxidoreductase [Temperatibacter marinus]|uniref:Molybdopterin-dependent oxidoreductase n=1 Tax=Temperatibacter marinus TaxID=1456591 RepID=A0AA52EC63_9PROT|nr:molybdopterin-dependent oxidoreductase [Temperatibacter marinus]WND02687.1 molybdopterin-dependent oxidoreductase [Temperatibacter marinus]